MTPKPDGPVVILSTGCLFHLPLTEIAAIGADAGFSGMELIINSPKVGITEEVARADALCPVRSLHAPFRNWNAWGGQMHSWKATTEIANWLPEAEQVTLHPPGTRLSNLFQHRWFHKAHDLRLLLDARGRVEFSLENLPWTGGTFGKDPYDQLLDLCREKNVGVTLDVCHLGVSGRDILRALDRTPISMIRNVHFSDALGYREHMPPGDGDLPLDDFLCQLAAAGYDRFITLELEPAAFPDERNSIVERLGKMLETMELALSKGMKMG